MDQYTEEEKILLTTLIQTCSVTLARWRNIREKQELDYPTEVNDAIDALVLLHQAVQ